MTNICAASSFVCAEPIVSGVSSDIGLSPRQYIITLQSHKSISKINYFRTVSTSTSQVKTRYVFPALHSVFTRMVTWKRPSICQDESPQRQWHLWEDWGGPHHLRSRGPTWELGQGRCLKCFDNFDSVQIFWSCDDDLTCPKRYNCTRRIGALRILANIIKTLQHPTENKYFVKEKKRSLSVWVSKLTLLFHPRHKLKFCTFLFCETHGAWKIIALSIIWDISMFSKFWLSADFQIYKGKSGWNFFLNKLTLVEAHH